MSGAVAAPKQALVGKSPSYIPIIKVQYKYGRGGEGRGGEAVILKSFLTLAAFSLSRLLQFVLRNINKRKFPIKWVRFKKSPVHLDISPSAPCVLRDRHPEGGGGFSDAPPPQ